MSKRCDNCINYVPLGVTALHGSKQELHGECHIMPPQASEAIHKGRWPLVFASEWCNEGFEPKDAPATVLKVTEPEPPATIPFPGARA